MEYYKLAKRENEKIKTLFHGSNGSREFPIEEWTKAEEKEGVVDGSGGTPYKSGFHVIEGFDNTCTYLKNFRNIEDKVIVKCEIDGKVRQKEHSRNKNVYLVEWVKITEIYEAVDFFLPF